MLSSVNHAEHPPHWINDNTFTRSWEYITTALSPFPHYNYSYQDAPKDTAAQRRSFSVTRFDNYMTAKRRVSGIDFMPRAQHPYFTDFTWSKFFMYMIAGVYVCSVGIVSVIEPWIDLPCDDDKVIQFPNPVYPDASPCRHQRYILLFGFTPTECAYARRLVASVLLGGLIGWERRQADRPAGIRTMSLVSLGSCLFTITSTFAFLNGPMAWDASRVSAAIPSGVGFLGAGLIFKKEETNSFGDSNHVVHGLTTAASVWLSAAVGIACGGDLYMPASFGVAIMMLLLRFGPRGNEGEEIVRGLEFDEESNEKMTDDEADGGGGVRHGSRIFDPLIASGGASLVDGNRPQSDYASIHNIQEEAESVTGSFRGVSLSQRAELMSMRAMSVRRRQPALGSMV